MVVVVESMPMDGDSLWRFRAMWDVEFISLVRNYAGRGRKGGGGVSYLMVSVSVSCITCISGMRDGAAGRGTGGRR